MTELKREYVIPLRRKSSTVPKWRRSKKAMSVLKEFIKKHMKTDIVIIGNELNEKIWENGIKNPPGKVSVVALKKNFNNGEKVLVNLLDVGIDSMLKQYETQVPVESNKEEVSDVEFKEKENTNEEKTTEVKEEKEEVKKDE